MTCEMGVRDKSMLRGLEFKNGFPWFTICCGNIGPLSPELILLETCDILPNHGCVIMARLENGYFCFQVVSDKSGQTCFCTHEAEARSRIQLPRYFVNMGFGLNVDAWRSRRDHLLNAAGRQYLIFNL